MTVVRLALLLGVATPIAAQVAPSGPWRTLETTHFRIHFRPTYRGLAGVAAREAERAYGLLAAELRAPRGVIDLTLGDDVDGANGFASTFPSNRITIFLAPPAADPGLQDYDSWLRVVIVHELTHVFHLDRSRGIWGALQTVFGRAPGFFPNEYQPSWVVEGLATYYESRFTGAGRATGSFHRQVTAADAAGGVARSPWDATYFTRWPAGLAPYAYGSRFFEDVGEQRGDSIVPRFIERTAGQLIPYRVGRQLRRAGLPGTLGDAWAQVIARAAPAAPSTSPSRRVIGALRDAPVLRVTADGRRLAYLHDDGRVTPRLRIAELPSWRVLRSHRVTGQVGYDWLGDTLVIAQLEFTDRWHVRSDLWRWTPDGAWRRSTHDARLTEPRGGARVISAVVLQPGDNASTLPGVPDPPGAAWGAVVPSPDGRWVAATRHLNGRWALVRWPAAAPESVAVLAEPPGVVSDPLWMGEGVLYVAEVAGFPQVHLWTADGVAQVTAEPLGARAPAALPGDTLAYTTLASGGWELRAAPLTRRSASVPVGAPAAFDSAPPVTMRETGYRAWPSLRPHFWLPEGRDAGPSGEFIGAATAGGDAVGRYFYLASALASLRPARAQGNVVLLLRGFGNPTLDLSASNDWSHLGTVGGYVVSVNDIDAALGATFVARRWRRFLSLRLAAEYEGSRFVARPDTAMAALCLGCRRRDLVGGSVSLAAGSLNGAPLAVSPLDGAVVNVLYRARVEQGTDRWSAEARGRLALYARLGPRVSFAHPVLALRLAAGTIDGPIPLRFSVGGVSSGIVDLGFGQTVGGTRTFPVRGYDGGTLRGSRAATASLEYRLPLALVGKAIGHLPLGADRFSLALFSDAGDAWDVGQRPRLHRLRSAGAELVSDLRVNYDFALRLRLGVAQPATGRTRVYSAFSADF